MAVGDALGQSVKGLKPETVKQHFKQVDDFKDTKPYIGKGIKRFRMQGLYGVQTQQALAVADSLLAKRKLDRADISDTLIRMSANGPDGYFGVFRRPEGCFYRAVQSLPNRRDPLQSEDAYATGAYLSMVVPIALYSQRHSPALLTQWVDAAMLMTRHPWEITGAALTGFLLMRFLEREPPPEDAGTCLSTSRILVKEATEFCKSVEVWLKENRMATVYSDDLDIGAMSQTFQELEHRIVDAPPEDSQAWIAANASAFLGKTVSHPTQGFALTLVPLALLRLLRAGNGFEKLMTDTLALGREADKLGTLVGAWGGAWHGFQSIPEKWKKGLVNAREIKLRGESLSQRKAPKGAKDLIEMELGLTQKEEEDGRRFLSRDSKKSAKTQPLEDLWLDDEPTDAIAELKEDPRKWRQFEKEKTRKKRDRRKNFPLE